MSISKELEQNIHDTINTLVEQDVKPTYEAIRGAGGYSYNSIKPALKSWRENKAAAGEPREQKSTEISVDEELKTLVLGELETMVTDLLVTVTTQAQEKANETLNLERSAHDEVVKDLKGEIVELENYIEKTDAEVAELKEGTARLEKTNAELVAKVELTSNDNQALKRHVESVESDNATLKTSNQSLTTDLTKANAEKSNLLEQNDKQKSAIEKSAKQFDDLQAKSNEQLTQIATLRGELKGFDKSDKQLRSELENLKAKHDDYVSQIATLKEQNKQLSSDVNDFELAQQTESELADLDSKKTPTARKTAAKK
jgi:chromosome segregation ATPase